MTQAPDGAYRDLSRRRSDPDWSPKASRCGDKLRRITYPEHMKGIKQSGAATIHYRLRINSKIPPTQNALRNINPFRK